jgi:hypothetical protein
MRRLLDAHNAYPEQGQFADRIEVALRTGVPVAIEQDLFWRIDSATGQGVAVVAHDDKHLADAPTLEEHFFQRVRPLMDSALAQKNRETWPQIVLNLDFKTNQPELHAAVWKLLGEHERWLTTAVRGNSDSVTSLEVGPMLVLTGTDSTQRVHFYEQVAPGSRLRLFGATPVPPPAGKSAEERARNVMGMSAEQLITQQAGNYARWVNFPWHVVEGGGPRHAAAWTPQDSTRLASLVSRAHANGLWIRFYALDGFHPDSSRGYIPDYNFGSDSAVRIRWQAAIQQGVDFIATDQYELFGMARGK